MSKLSTGWALPAILLWVSASICGCGRPPSGTESPPDAATVEPEDAGTNPADAGPPPDAGLPPDAGPLPDGGAPAKPRAELTCAAGKVSGGGYTLDFQVGHFAEQKPVGAVGKKFEGAALVK